jgi:glyoxylase-like metal-dependent hydrolase (beta-lactamase superfamily II)
MRNFLCAALFVMLLGPLVSSLVLADNTGGDVKVSTTKIAENLFYFSTSGVNRVGNVVALIGRDGTLLVDSQFDNVAALLMDAVKNAGGDIPKFLINTHYHGDHSGGNAWFGRRGTLLIGHARNFALFKSGASIPVSKTELSPLPRVAWPMITFSDEITLHFDGEVVRAISVQNAHTAGDVLVHFVKANVIHSGDILFFGALPFIDVDHGGTLPGMIAAVDKILAFSDSHTQIIPGHGPLVHREDVVWMRGMLQQAYDILMERRRAGKSPGQVLKENPLSDWAENFGHNDFLTAKKWTALVYPSLPVK